MTHTGVARRPGSTRGTSWVEIRRVVAALVVLVAAVLPVWCTPPASADTYATVSGTVLGSDGSPLAGIAVSAWEVTTNHSKCQVFAQCLFPDSGDVYTGTDGSYALELRPGEYTLSFDPEFLGPDNFYFGQWYGGSYLATARYCAGPICDVSFGKAIGDQQLFDLMSGQAYTATTTDLSLGGGFQGLVTPYKPGFVVEGHELGVTVFGKAGGEQPVGHDGSFSADEIYPPGDYGLSAGAALHGVSYHYGRRFMEASQYGTLAAGEIVTDDITEPPVAAPRSFGLPSRPTVGRRVCAPNDLFPDGVRVDYHWSVVHLESRCVTVAMALVGKKLHLRVEGVLAGHWNRIVLKTSAHRVERA